MAANFKTLSAKLQKADATMHRQFLTSVTVTFTHDELAMLIAALDEQEMDRILRQAGLSE